MGLISAEQLCKNEYWILILASFLLILAKSACIFSDWDLAIIIPSFKKENKDNPVNYCLVSLFSLINKIYTRHNYWKLLDWMEDEILKNKEWVKFRVCCSMLDQFFIVSHLIEK